MVTALRTALTDPPPFPIGAHLRDLTGERYEVLATFHGFCETHGPHWAWLRNLATNQRWLICLLPLDTFTLIEEPPDV